MIEECRNCHEGIESCSRCGYGSIHVDTQFHSCAKGGTMAQPMETPDAET